MESSVPGSSSAPVGTCVNAQPAGPTVELERRRRLDLDLGYDDTEDDPRAVALCDRQRVLPEERDPRLDGGRSVDVIVVVHQHAVVASETPAERLESLAERRVLVPPRVAREAAVIRGRRRHVARVAQRPGDNRPRALEQALRVTRDLWPRHGEAHVAEEPAAAALVDVALRVHVRLGGCSAHDI